MSLFQCPLDRKKVDRLFNTVILIGLMVLLIALLSYSIPGFYSRYLADDYCFSDQIRNKGILGGLTFFYQNISNRFGAFLFISITELFGEKAIQVLPGFMVFILILALLFSFYWFLKFVKISDSVKIALLVSALTIFLVLFQAPNLFQSLYWRSGMASYFAPLPFFFIVSGIILRQNQTSLSNKLNWVLVIMVLLLAFFSGGMSETYAAFQTAFWILLLVGLMVCKKQTANNQTIPLNLAAITGSVLAMGVMILAPGNQLRLNTLSQAGNIWVVFQLSFRYAFDFILETLHGLSVPTIYTLITSALLAYHLSANRMELIQNKRSGWFLLIIPLVAFLLIASICAPTVYGMLAYPEPRALIIARMVMTLAVIIFGGLLGILSHRFMDRIINICFASILVLGLMWFYPVRGMVQSWQQIPALQERAVVWDARRAGIAEQKSMGNKKITVSVMDSLAGVAELSPDPHFWVNQCAAGYYGLESIKAVNQIP